MKRTHLIAVLAGIVAVGIFAADASAFYNSGTGTWLQRDPGPGGMMRIDGGAASSTGQFIPRDQYADGMNLYQYAGSRPLNRKDPSGLFGVLDLGDEIGSVEITYSEPVKVDRFGYHERGWLFGVKWLPPRGGDWDKPCDCRPCQRVVWVQDVSMWTGLSELWTGSGGQMVNDWGPEDAEKYGTAWDCHKKGSTAATSFDKPGVAAVHRYLLRPFPVRFHALTIAKCVAGKDAGKIYAKVDWTWRWDYDKVPEQESDTMIYGTDLLPSQ